MRARLAILLLLACLPAVAGAAVRPALVGTSRADLLLGRDGADRVLARAGNDRIAVEYDGAVDRVSCGAGRDIVAADPRDRLGADCEVVSRRISRDRHTNTDAQHESEVEPDSLTVGQTTVAVFQVGRIRVGASTSIGFATSRDGGRTWQEGLLPALTAGSSPPGPSQRASDPVVAWDAVHSVWLANSLALGPGVSRLTIHRSTDGIHWSGPVDAALTEQPTLAYDKNWLTCDNGPASPFRGRCYLAYTLVGEQRDDLAVQRSDDGGRTWSAAVTVRLPNTGVIPLVRPDGTLVIPFWSERTGMLAVNSQDGGVTLSAPTSIAELRAADVRPLRGPPLVAAEVDPAGRVLVVWQDCRFRPSCDGNDVVLSQSIDGRSWTEPTRVTRGRNVAIPTIGIDPGTGRLAVAYYTLRAGGVDAELVTSANGGAAWTAPQRLTPRTMPFTWLPETTLGRMLADYIGVSWSRGRPLVVYAVASPPRNGKLHQAIYAARG